MSTEMIDYKEKTREMRRALDEEQERLTDKIDRLNGLMKMADVTDKLISELESLRDELEAEREENERLRQQLKEKEMQLNELSKLTTGVAKKSSQDDLVKALQTYANRSKRKTADKRAFAKSAILEIANANGLMLSEELRVTIDSLDDEQPDPKLTIHAQGDVKVEGDYNDIHDNKAVNF